MRHWTGAGNDLLTSIPKKKTTGSSAINVKINGSVLEEK